MIVLNESLDIPGNAHQVLRYVADFENLPSWDPSVLRVVRRDRGELEAGSGFRVWLRSIGRAVEFDYRVVELGVLRAELQGSSPSVRASDVITAEQRGERVALDYRVEISLSGWLRHLEPALRPRILADGRAAITKLEGVLTGLAAASAGSEPPCLTGY